MWEKGKIPGAGERRGPGKEAAPSWRECRAAGWSGACGQVSSPRARAPVASAHQARGLPPLPTRAGRPWARPGAAACAGTGGPCLSVITMRVTVTAWRSPPCSAPTSSRSRHRSEGTTRRPASLPTAQLLWVLSPR